MSTTMDAIKELLDKVPNLQEMIVEATKPAERRWQEVCWIFNGFDDDTLLYAGQPYHLKFGEITKISGKPGHKEVDQFASKDGFVHYTQLPLTGERIAREMIEARDMNKRGFVVLLEPRISEDAKTAALSLGYDFKMNRIEAYKLGRDRAKAGQAGKIRPDKMVYKWMKQYAPDDEIFAKQSTKTDAASNVAEALKMLAENQKQMIAMQATIQRLEQQVRGPAEAPETAPQTQTLTPPRKKPLESDVAYVARITEWKTVNNVR